MPLKTGDALPTDNDCDNIANPPFMFPHNDDGTLAFDSDASVREAGKLPLASRRDEYIDRLEDNYIALCEAEEDDFCKEPGILLRAFIVDGGESGIPRVGDPTDDDERETDFYLRISATESEFSLAGYRRIAETLNAYVHVTSTGTFNIPVSAAPVNSPLCGGQGITFSATVVVSYITIQYVESVTVEVTVSISGPEGTVSDTDTGGASVIYPAIQCLPSVAHSAVLSVYSGSGP